MSLPELSPPARAVAPSGASSLFSGYTMQQHLDEAALALDEAGCSLVTCTRYAAGRARPLWELLAPDVVLGFSPFDADELASMRACGITRIVPAPEHPTTLDDWPALTAGTALQIDHLYEQGHRRIAFAAPADPHTSPFDRRVHTAHQAAARLGLDPIDVRPVGHSVGAAVPAGVSVPDELAVIGHDDTPLAAMFVPSISSVRIDIVSLGRHFAAFALHEADGRPLPPRDSRADTVVVARESTQTGSGTPHEAAFASADGTSAEARQP